MRLQRERLDDFEADISIEKDGRGNPATWIDDGEKYALVGLKVKVEEYISFEKITPCLWVLADTTFNVPPHWREWLGSIRAGEVEDFNLFLRSKLPSLRPDVLDGENEKLKQRVWHFYVGLLLASSFAPAHKPVMLTGSRRDGAVDIRQQQDLDCPIHSLVGGYSPILAKDIRLAAQLAGKIDALGVVPINGGHWRFFRTLFIYTEARTIADILDRIHQYCRCIDGLILPDVGKTKAQFKYRTGLFIGPRHHVLIGEIYDVRSAVEHLHENRYLESFDRETRLDLLKKEAIHRPDDRRGQREFDLRLLFLGLPRAKVVKLGLALFGWQCHQAGDRDLNSSLAPRCIVRMLPDLAAPT